MENIAGKFEMNFKGVKRVVIVNSEGIYTKDHCKYSDMDVISDLEELIFDDEELTIEDAISQGILTEIGKPAKIENAEIPEAAKSGKLWESGSKKRYYLSEGYCQAANAFFSTTEDYGKYCWKVAGGFVYAAKCYNGAVKEQVIADFGEVL